MTGQVVCSLSGAFEVQTSDSARLRCCARKNLKQEAGGKLLVGDHVELEPLDDGTGVITALLPRKNQFTRPAVANLDQLCLISSLTQPRPNLRLLDLLLAGAEALDVEALVLFTKCDLAEVQDLSVIYRAYPCFFLEPSSDLSDLRLRLPGKVTAFCGNTGVGKSTLLQRLAPDLTFETGEISPKLGRGRHTTRHVELFPVAGGLVADTPGFGSLEVSAQAALAPETLAVQFREFLPFLSHCKFTGCTHRRDQGCAVRAAVEASEEIPRSRWESYCALYEQINTKNYK